MKTSLRFLLPALAALCLVAFANLMASAKKEAGITVRFYPEAIGGDVNTFPDPVQLVEPDRKIYRSKIAAISENEISSIYLYQVSDGSAGCVFMLNDRGKAALDALSVERHGSTLTAVVNDRMIINMLIDRRISDGILVIPHGLTIKEGMQLKNSFRMLKTPPGPMPTPTPSELPVSPADR